jgi:outer membrane lipoprotein SlyB
LNLSDGQHVEITTDSFTKMGPQSRAADAEKIGGGAALGAIIGAIAGGGKGAAIGAGVGGAAGTGTVAATRGKAAVLPSETKVSFRINNSVTVTERRRRS